MYQKRKKSSKFERIFLIQRYYLSLYILNFRLILSFFILLFYSFSLSFQTPRFDHSPPSSSLFRGRESHRTEQTSVLNDKLSPQGSTAKTSLIKRPPIGKTFQNFNFLSATSFARYFPPSIGFSSLYPLYPDLHSLHSTPLLSRESDKLTVLNKRHDYPSKSCRDQD